MDVQITAAQADDVEQLASLHVQGWREAYGQMLPERFYDDSALSGRRRMWSRLLDDEARPHECEWHGTRTESWGSS